MSCVWELLTSLLTTLLLELIVLSYYILWWRSGATGLQREGVEPVSRTKQKPLFNYLPYFSNQTDPKIFIRTAPNPEKYNRLSYKKKIIHTNTKKKIYLHATYIFRGKFLKSLTSKNKHFQISAHRLFSQLQSKHFRNSIKISLRTVRRNISARQNKTIFSR